MNKSIKTKQFVYFIAFMIASGATKAVQATGLAHLARLSTRINTLAPIVSVYRTLHTKAPQAHNPLEAEKILKEIELAGLHKEKKRNTEQKDESILLLSASVTAFLLTPPITETPLIGGFFPLLMGLYAINSFSTAINKKPILQNSIETIEEQINFLKKQLGSPTLD